MDWGFLTDSCKLVYGRGDCSELHFCYGRGNCSGVGLCDCYTGYSGVDCSIEVKCQYWDHGNSAWSSEGCVQAPPPSGPDGLLHCDCNHLTDFGGIGIPTSPEELLAELTSISFNTFSLDDMMNALSSFSFDDNPAAFLLIIICTCLNLLTVIFANFRLHRRILVKARMRRDERKKKRQKALDDKATAKRGRTKIPNPGADDGPIVGKRVEEPAGAPASAAARKKLDFEAPQGNVEEEVAGGDGTGQAGGNGAGEGKGKGKIIDPNKLDPASINQDALQSRIMLHWSEPPASALATLPASSTPSNPSSDVALPEPPQLTSAAGRARELRSKYAQQREGLDRFRLSTLSQESSMPEPGSANRGALQDRITAVQVADPAAPSPLLQDRVPMLPSSSPPLRSRPPRNEAAVSHHLSRIRGQDQSIELSPQQRAVLAARRRARATQGAALQNFAARQDRLPASLPPSPPETPPEAMQGRVAMAKSPASSRTPLPQTKEAEMFAQRMESNRGKISPMKSKTRPSALSPAPATPSLVSLQCASTPASRADSSAAPGGLAARLAAGKGQSVLSPDPATPSLVSLQCASTPASRSSGAPGGLAARLAAGKGASSEEANGDPPKKGLGALMAVKGDAQGLGAKPSLWGGAGKSGLAQHKLTREKSIGNLIMAAKLEARRQEQTRAAQMLLDMKGGAKGKWDEMTNSMKAEARIMSQMRKEGRYLDLVKYIVFNTIKYVKTKLKAFWVGLRREHAIVSFLYPLDDETAVVTDPQVAQIFWNMLLSELMALAMLYDNDDDGPLISIKIVILAMIAAGICAGSGMLCRAVFRWGNKGKRFQRRIKEKKAAKKNLKPGDDRGGAEVTDAERMKQAFQKAKEPKKRSLREIVDCGRVTLAWVFNIAFYLIMCWFTYTYAILFGPEETNGWMMSFVLASGNAWLIIEPFEVVLIVMLPFLFDNKCVAKCRVTAKELGLI